MQPQNGHGTAGPAASGADQLPPECESSLLVRVQARGVGKKFAKNRRRGDFVTALDDINLDVREGEFCCIVGPTGCGKTTLLRIIAGLERPTEGELSVRRVDPARPVNTLVFQEQAIFPWMNVAKNIGYGLVSAGAPVAERNDRVAFWLDKMNLASFARSYPHQLSGGMKQRVSLARSLALRPELLLMDEPFASVDEQTRVMLQNELLRLWGEVPTTVVFITHSIDEAVALADRVVVLSARPATVRAVLPVDLPRPRDVVSVKASPEFGTLVGQVWHLLKAEVTNNAQEAG